MRLLSFRDLKAIKGIPYSRAHIHRLVKRGQFPPPIKVNASRHGVNAWSESEIDRYLENLFAARDRKNADQPELGANQ